jgi:hypothetical protein
VHRDEIRVCDLADHAELVLEADQLLGGESQQRLQCEAAIVELVEHFVDGTVGTRTEELLLRELPELTDCTVVGVADDGVRADWDGDGVAEAYALLQLADEVGGSDEELTVLVNTALKASAFPPVTRALRMKPDDVAKGATGKVLKRVMRDRFAAKERQR